MSRSSSHSQRLEPVAQGGRLLELERAPRPPPSAAVSFFRIVRSRPSRNAFAAAHARRRTPSACTPPTHGPRHVPSSNRRHSRARSSGNSSGWSANASGTVCGQSRSLNQSFSRRAASSDWSRHDERAVHAEFLAGRLARDEHVRGRRLAEAEVVVPLEPGLAEDVEPRAEAAG